MSEKDYDMKCLALCRDVDTGRIMIFNQLNHRTVDVTDAFNEIVGIIKSQPTPRPLSKGDWAMSETFGLCYIGRDDLIACGQDDVGRIYQEIYKLDGSNEVVDIGDFTRIDLTEEHLKMLDTDEVKYYLKDYVPNKDWDRQYYVYAFSKGEFGFEYTYKAFPTSHEAISECLKDVISRRRFDREMGV